MSTRDRVQVFRVALDQGDWSGGERLLDSHERQRLAQFHFERDRTRYLRSHVALREILAMLTGEAPGALRIEAGPHGKPLIPGSRLQFGLSHSAEVALIAAAWDRAVGVDVEQERAEVDLGVARYFSEREQEGLAALPEPERRHAFFRAWVCKEAYLKARGTGLLDPLDAFDVEVALALPVALLATRPDAAEAARWRLAEVPMHGDLVAALATEAGPLELEVRDWARLRP